MPTSTSTSLQLILTIVSPPPEVRFAVQRGRDELLAPFVSSADEISFAISVDLGPSLADGALNFRGPFTQGTLAERFVYVNSGVRAGQTGTPWERRAKVTLGRIPRELVDAASGHADRAIEARILGTMRDGGPVCATVRPEAITWQVVTRPSVH